MRSGVRVLVFHRAAGFVHLSIPASVEALRALGREHDFGVDTTDDPARFTDDIGFYDVVVFLQTSGDVLPELAQRRALETYLADGGGFFGIHAASSMGEVAADWPWYRDLIGASFKGHTVAEIYSDGEVSERPGVRHAGPLAEAPTDAERYGDALAITSWEAATVHVEDPSCAAIRGVADGDELTDEWYGFHDNPRGLVNVVATVDESTYEPHLGEMGADHPIVWWREFGGGRSVYNSMGHSVENWNDPRFLATIVGGIELAAETRNLRRLLR